MKSMTYGVMPSHEDFDAAFERECPNGYNITLGASDSKAVDGFKLGDGCWTADQLWDAVNEIVTHWATDTNDEAGDLQDTRVDLVSCILGTLGFEWI